MADNTTLEGTLGSSGDVIRTEDRTTYKTPVSLLDVGGIAGESLIGDSGVFMPVEGAAAENAAVAGNPILVGARYDASPRTLGDGDVGAIALNASGQVIVRPLTNADVVTAELSATDNAVLDAIAASLAVVGAGSEATAIRVTLANDSTGLLSIDDGGGFISIDDGGNTITIDGTVGISGTVTVGTHAVTNVGTFAVQVDGTALTRLTDIETNTNSLAVVGGGTEATAVRVTIASDSTGVLSVDDNGGSITVDGTVAVSGTVTVGSHAVTNAGTFATQASGSVAHDGGDSGNPVKIGAKATTSLSALTLVVNNDRTNLFAGVDGVLITRPHCNLEGIVAGNASNTDGASTSVIAAGGAGIKHYLTSFSITNTSATDTYCEIKSGTTVRWTVPVPAGGGVTHSFAVPLPPNAANEAWNFDMGAATTTAYCSMVGFKSKV